MATELFPSTLPGVLLQGYANEEDVHFRRNNVQSGPPVYVKLTNRTPVKFSVRWNFSQFDLQVFEGWFKKNILYGSLPFDMSLPVGMGDVVHECFFLDRYNVSRILKRVSVTASILAIEKQYNTDAEIDDLLALAAMTDARNQESFFNIFVNFGEVSLPDAWETINYGTDFS